MKYEKIKLNYSFNACEPYLKAVIISDHYIYNHTAYQDKLNLTLKDNKLTEQYSTIKAVLQHIKEFPSEIQQKIINFGGGLYNHNLFFSLLKKDVDFKGLLLTLQIEKTFGSFEKFQMLFKEKALSVFGSGWVWLVQDIKTKSISLIQTVNQDTPDLNKYQILFGIDFWEHAYAKQFTANRGAYFDNVWKCLDWIKINERLLK